MRIVTLAASAAVPILSIVSALASTPRAEAQVTGDPLAGNIRQIIIEGNQRIEARTVQSYLLVEPGSPFDEERLDLSLKTLFGTGLFADVSIERQGPDLIVRVIENPIINRVIFEGNRALDDDRLREEIQAAPRGIFTAARVQADVQRILELYRQSGRFSAEVNPQYKPLDQNRVDLIFEITDGPVTGVRSINFIGNEDYSDSRLRGEIVTKQSRFWRFFDNNDNYDPGRLDFDREQLRQFYQNNGYYDFSVKSAVAELTPDREDFYITFTVEEGEQYTFGEIDVETTLDKLDENILARVVPIRPGSLYRGQQIEDAIDTLTRVAGISGYAFVDVRPRLEPNPDTRTVDVTFALDEGPRVYIERINIIGNTQTLDRVVRRELRVSEGDAFNRVLLDRSRNRVRALGFFSEVEITEQPGSQPDRTVVDVAVTEQPTGEISFAAGISSVDNFLVDFSITQRNLGGRGQSLSAAVTASDRQQNVRISFTEPRFLDRNLAAGVDIFGTTADFLDVSGFESTTFGGAVRFGFPLTERSSLGLRYRISQDELEVADSDIVIDAATGTIATQLVTGPDGSVVEVAVPPALEPLPDGTLVVDQCSELFVNRSPICLSERSELTSQIGYTFRWDRRNDPITPTRGFDFSFSQDLAGVGGDVRFLRTETQGTIYRGLLPGVRASFRLGAGWIFAFADDDGLRINNRFFRGGNSFRGFDVAGIGPRVVQFEIDPETGEQTGRVFREEALGGEFYYQGTFELTFPNYLPEAAGIQTALFLEAGSLGNLDEETRETFTPFIGTRILPNGENVTFIETIQDNLSLRASTGLSVFWRSPFGPIRFDFTHVIQDEDFDRNRGFRFSTTTAF